MCKNEFRGCVQSHIVVYQMGKSSITINVNVSSEASEPKMLVSTKGFDKQAEPLSSFPYVFLSNEHT